MSQPKITNIRGASNRLGVAIDIMMLCLTILDLLWLMFDAAYGTQTVRHFVDGFLPFDYNPIHQDFYFYDGFIVSIFILEFIGRWTYAIYYKHFGKWFFYPFAHWYDILGCFPTGSFRILRLFRVIGLIYRLHRWNVIDLNGYSLFNKLKEYYVIIMEEISDRVVITVLTEAKARVTLGKPLNTAIIEEVIKPKKAELAGRVGKAIQDGIQQKYPQYQNVLEKQIKEVVQKEVSSNREVQNIARVPLIGGQIKSSLNEAVSEIVFGVIDQLIKDIGEEENSSMLQLVISSVIDVFLEYELLQNNKLGNQVIIETIDLVIERVKVQQWKKTTIQ